VADAVAQLAADWCANNPQRARTHRPVFKGNPFSGWCIDGDTPIRPAPKRLDGGYTIPGPTAAQLAHGAPLAAGGIVDRNVHLVSIGEQPCAGLVDVRPVPDPALAALLEEARSYNWPGANLRFTKPTERLDDPAMDAIRAAARSARLLDSAKPAEQPPATAWARLLEEARALAEQLAATIRRRIQGQR
jgi:hypothetical protein